MVSRNPSSLDLLHHLSCPTDLLEALPTVQEKLQSSGLDVIESGKIYIITSAKQNAYEQFFD